MLSSISHLDLAMSLLHSCLTGFKADNNKEAISAQLLYSTKVLVLNTAKIDKIWDILHILSIVCTTIAYSIVSSNNYQILYYNV